MPLKKEDIINEGLNNIEEITRIMGRDKKLLEMIDKYDNINDIKKNDYFNFTLYKIKYYLYKWFDEFQDTFNDEIDIIFNSNISYYDILLNIFFLTFVIIVGVIMYWDSVYRIARKNSRCAIIDKIIDENKVSQSPYIYNIYIVKNNYENSFKDKYLIKLTYDFTTNGTNNDTKYIEDDINSIYNSTEGDGFNYYDLNLKKSIKNLNKQNIIDDINNRNLSLVITDDKDNIINTDHSNSLKEFVKKYNSDNKTSLEPIYNIKNAYNKIKGSDY